MLSWLWGNWMADTGLAAAALSAAAGFYGLVATEVSQVNKLTDASELLMKMIP